LCNDKESSVEQLLAEGTCLTSRVSQNFPQSRAVSANNIHIVKTDAAGNPLSSLDFGGSATDTPFAAAMDPQGNLIIVGWTSRISHWFRLS